MGGIVWSECVPLCAAMWSNRTDGHVSAGEFGIRAGICKAW